MRLAVRRPRPVRAHEHEGEVALARQHLVVGQGEDTRRAGRLYEPKPRTSLFWIDEKTGKITECLTFPSGGDTSYPGLVWQDGVLHMSYYSSHEEDKKSRIYFARIKFPGAPASSSAASR